MDTQFCDVVSWVFSLLLGGGGGLLATCPGAGGGGSGGECAPPAEGPVAYASVVKLLASDRW